MLVTASECRPPACPSEPARLATPVLALNWRALKATAVLFWNDASELARASVVTCGAELRGVHDRTCACSKQPGDASALYIRLSVYAGRPLVHRCPRKVLSRRVLMRQHSGIECIKLERVANEWSFHLLQQPTIRPSRG